MAIDERKRYDLYQTLEGVLGADQASTLMEHLPPVGWADVATKRDIEQLAVATKRDIEQLRVDQNQLGAQFDVKLDSFKYEILATIRGELRQNLFAMMGLFVTLAGVAFGAARLV